MAGAKVGTMAALLDDPDLNGLRLPDLDDTVTPSDLLVGPADADDLAAVFRPTTAVGVDAPLASASSSTTTRC